MYDQEMKGTASAEAGASEALQAKENAGVSQVRTTLTAKRLRHKQPIMLSKILIVVVAVAKPYSALRLHSDSDL